MQDDTRIIFLDPFPRTQAMVYTQDVAAELADLGKVIAHFGSRAPDDLVEEHLGDISVLIGQTAMPEERLIKAENLRAIINVKANWEPNIDYAAAHRLGIHVLSAAPAMAPAVAEHCLGQAIALARGFYRAGRLSIKAKKPTASKEPTIRTACTTRKRASSATATWANACFLCCGRSDAHAGYTIRGCRTITCVQKACNPPLWMKCYPPATSFFYLPGLPRKMRISSVANIWAKSARTLA